MEEDYQGTGVCSLKHQKMELPDYEYVSSSGQENKDLKVIWKLVRLLLLPQA